ncbi:N-acetylmuramoyl-L-alanine amidase family protein [Clostridium weizhouense]|uniref:N-acetylmuramoyl-L-alanine amidase family protein n=1 Tax=Clostridium weizhouense TaxID=2859781 RepID=A0ABS7ARY5_9CLOT|nr:N-acetylmuramoyl-L-alanine amidase family protein [Clostridium weizhouense]MBW6410250.1 N-acetylmuramoyl-L-alanine amidase family protein [Clostridium weizhouense]
MFKRANKMTALLVAAAAVVSLVPATGVNAADYKRIESKDGTVYSAVAYKNGAFVIDGNVKDGDTDAVYFLNNGKYTELEDVDTGSDFSIYGEKYATVDTDDYYVDLTNGKVTDDSVAEDNMDDASVALRNKVKKDNDDRYTDATAKDLPKLEKMEGSKFGETWYEAKYDGKNVYSDAKGNYIDADYNLGKIKVEVTTGTSAKTVTLKNTEDKEDGVGAGQEVGAKITAADVIGQDKNNIYRKATIEITAGTDTIKEINGKAVATATSTVEFKVIQKISKAQASDDIDGAKYAKTVTNYAVADEDGAAMTLTETTYSVVDGKILAYTYDESGDKVDVRSLELKTSKGYYYLNENEADQEDDVKAFEVDAEGNLWILKSGFVYKFDNKEDWDKVYKVDGSMEKMSVYNKDNMVLWNEDDEVYSVIGNKEEETEKPVEVTKGWVQAADGTWTYVKEDGTKATAWLNLNGTWYYLNAEGVMQTGWINNNGTWYYTNASGAMLTGWANVNGTWYFLNASGAMQTGWINDNGTWYFCNASGAMQANTVVDGYTLGANGAWIR